MVFVQGGTFQMGNTSGNGDEQPGHGVTLSSFYIDKYEVTVAQYRAFCTATGRNSLSSPPFWGWNDNDPIVFVSWYDATAYAAWAGKRLPTEAEWEYAARGGKLSHGYIFAGSNSLDSVAWGANNGSKPHMGGTKSPNELGVYDMSGNVWEWVYDWYAPYPSAAVTNPSGPVSGTIRVLRGGCWYYFAGACSVTFRGYLAGDPTSTDHGVGFRCAQDY
jgi:formylglycine-generating enzyme